MSARPSAAHAGNVGAAGVKAARVLIERGSEEIGGGRRRFFPYRGHD